MTCLSASDREVLTQRLREAEEAYHTMMMGGAVVSVTDQNGERVEYSKANAQRLQAYIGQLKQRLGSGTGPLNVWIA